MNIVSKKKSTDISYLEMLYKDNTRNKEILNEAQKSLNNIMRGEDLVSNDDIEKFQKIMKKFEQLFCHNIAISADKCNEYMERLQKIFEIEGEFSEEVKKYNLSFNKIIAKLKQ